MENTPKKKWQTGRRRMKQGRRRRRGCCEECYFITPAADFRAAPPISGRRYVSYVGKDPRGSLRDRSIDHLAACMRTIPRL